MSLGLGYHSSLAAMLGNLQDVTARITEQTSPAIQETRDKLRDLTVAWKTDLSEYATLSKQYMHLLKPKKKWQLFLIAAVICGIELAYSAETAFVSPILLKIGIPASLMSLIWCLSPILGLVLVPIMGSLSDNCHSRFGKRRPFIFILSLGIVLGLILVPNGRYIGAAIAGVKAPYVPRENYVPKISTQTQIKLGSSNSVFNSKTTSKQARNVTALGIATTTQTETPTKTTTKNVSLPSEEDYYYYYYYYDESNKTRPSKKETSSGINNSIFQRSKRDFEKLKSVPVKPARAAVTEEAFIEVIEFQIPEDSVRERKYGEAKYLSILFTCVGVVILDFCADASQSPARAYMLDVCLPEQHTLGLTTFTILAGLGGSLGYMLGAINWERSFTDIETKIANRIAATTENISSIGGSYGGIDLRLDQLPAFVRGRKDHYRIVFSIILVLFVICLIVTLNSFKELPLNYDIHDRPVEYGRRFTKSWFKEMFVDPKKSEDNLARKPNTSNVGPQSYDPLIIEEKISNDHPTSKSIDENNLRERNSSFELFIREQRKSSLSSRERSPSPQSGDSIIGDGLKMPEQYLYTGPKKNSLDYFSSHITTRPLTNSPTEEDSSDSDYVRKGQSFRNKIKTYATKQMPDQLKKKDEVKEEKKLKAPVSLKSYLRSIIKMPKFLRLLCLTNLFSWMSLVCYSLYFTDYVGQSIFGGDPNSPEYSLTHQKYEEGVRFGCWGMSLYSVTCAIYSYSIEKLVKKFGAKKVYVYGQLTYSIGILIMGIARSRACVIIFSISPGIMYATLFTMPYILITHFHQQNCWIETTTDENMLDIGESNQMNQLRGLGTDIAIVSSMVFWAQCILSSVIGTMMDKFNTTAIVPYIASILSFTGAVCAWNINYPKGI